MDLLFLQVIRLFSHSPSDLSTLGAVFRENRTLVANSDASLSTSRLENGCHAY